MAVLWLMFLLINELIDYRPRIEEAHVVYSYAVWEPGGALPALEGTRRLNYG